jgi:hypothetical protein
MQAESTHHGIAALRLFNGDAAGGTQSQTQLQLLEFFLDGLFPLTGGCVHRVPFLAKATKALAAETHHFRRAWLPGRG